MSNINTLASEFAAKHGSFSLEFIAEQNYVKPDDCPWTLCLNDEAYAGFTAEEVIAFADTSTADTEKQA